MLVLGSGPQPGTGHMACHLPLHHHCLHFLHSFLILLLITSHTPLVVSQLCGFEGPGWWLWKRQGWQVAQAVYCGCLKEQCVPMSTCPGQELCSHWVPHLKGSSQHHSERCHGSWSGCHLYGATSLASSPAMSSSSLRRPGWLPAKMVLMGCPNIAGCCETLHQAQERLPFKQGEPRIHPRIFCFPLQHGT